MVRIVRNKLVTTNKTILQTSSPWQAVHPSGGVNSMDPLNLTQITSLEGVGRWRYCRVLYNKSIKEKLSNNTYLIVCCVSGPSWLVHLSKNQHSIVSLIQQHSLYKNSKFINLTKRKLCSSILPTVFYSSFTSRIERSKYCSLTLTKLPQMMPILSYLTYSLSHLLQQKWGFYAVSP